ncbi:MAG: hypothetical protein FJW40_14795 [Acidobacteria bacterium]|nr:hypothetical protein [Acidobacteriota bacterium]
MAYTTLGRAYLYRGCRSDALVNLRHGVELAREDYLPWTNLSRALHALRPGSEEARAAHIGAERTASQALEKDPGHTIARAYHALSLAHQGRHREALDEIGRALRQPTGTHAGLAIVEIFEFAGNRTRALAELEAQLKRGMPLAEPLVAPSLAALRTDSRFKDLLSADGFFRPSHKNEN